MGYLGLDGDECTAIHGVPDRRGAMAAEETGEGF